MKAPIAGIVGGLIAGLIIAIWLRNSEAITGIIGVLGTVLYKALRVLHDESGTADTKTSV